MPTFRSRSHRNSGPNSVGGSKRRKRIPTSCSPGTKFSISFGAVSELLTLIPPGSGHRPRKRHSLVRCTRIESGRQFSTGERRGSISYSAKSLRLTSSSRLRTSLFERFRYLAQAVFFGQIPAATPRLPWEMGTIQPTAAGAPLLTSLGDQILVNQKSRSHNLAPWGNAWYTVQHSGVLIYHREYTPRGSRSSDQVLRRELLCQPQTACSGICGFPSPDLARAQTAAADYRRRSVRRSYSSAGDQSQP